MLASATPGPGSGPETARNLEGSDSDPRVDDKLVTPSSSAAEPELGLVDDLTTVVGSDSDETGEESSESVTEYSDSYDEFPFDITCSSDEEVEEDDDGDDEIEVMDREEEEKEVAGGTFMPTRWIEPVPPPVPHVEVSLEPHHQILPVGIISTILGDRIVVDGLVKHNPLKKGSILWITESRSLLGLVDEICGPVKNPYYLVRYNSDKVVPVGIRVGTDVSFATEFANYILSEKDLYKKGYDASGENDEELTDEEFSDDEKEAEYKNTQQQPNGVLPHGVPPQQPNAFLPYGLLLQQPLNAVWPAGSPLQQQRQHNAAWPAGSVLPQGLLLQKQQYAMVEGLPQQLQPMGFHGGYSEALQSPYQNRAFNSCTSRVPCQQQLTPNLGVQTAVPWPVGPLNQPIGNGFDGGYSNALQSPCNGNNMPGQGSPGSCDEQRVIQQQQATAEDGIHPLARFNIG